MSSTSPRAQRVARRGEALRPQEQQREEQVGQEEAAALEGLVDGAAVVGVRGKGLRAADAAGPVETLWDEPPVAAAADSTEWGQTPRRSAAGTAAASAVGLALLGSTMLQPSEEGPDAEEAQGEPGLADPPAQEGAESPPTLEAPAIAAAVAEAVGRQEQPPIDSSVPAAAESAGMPAAVEGADMQEHGPAEGDTEGPVVVAAAGEAPARRKQKSRAQPAPRRPGAALGPGAPGPLRGWLRQEQTPPVRGRSLSSAPQPATGLSERSNTGEAGQALHGARQPNQGPQPAGGPPTARHTTHRETRSATRGRGIVWGRPTGAGRATMANPWVSAGRGLRPALERGGGADAPPVGTRGGRGGRGGARGGRIPLLGGEAAIARSGTWRDRHDRPEQEPVPATGEDVGSDNSQSGSAFMPSASVASEEFSLGEEEVEHLSTRRRGSRGRAGGLPPPSDEGANRDPRGVAPQPSEKSPADLAKDETIWHLAGTWDTAPLQQKDQPFLVRRCLDGVTIFTSPDPSATARASGGKPLDKNRDEAAPL
ncbi:unnamed protein product [Closterium sp. NIES-64]|nr:unnamed protein product [Closterium sp. NIES-64]